MANKETYAQLRERVNAGRPAATGTGGGKGGYSALRTQIIGEAMPTTFLPDPLPKATPAVQVPMSDDDITAKNMETLGSWDKGDQTAMSNWLQYRPGGAWDLFNAMSNAAMGVTPGYHQMMDTARASAGYQELGDKHGEQETARVANSLERERNAQVTQNVREESRRMAEGGNIGHDLLSIVTKNLGDKLNLLGLASAASLETGQYQSADPNHWGNLLNVYTQEVRQQGAQSFGRRFIQGGLGFDYSKLEGTAAGKAADEIGSVIYNGAMSWADSALRGAEASGWIGSMGLNIDPKKLDKAAEHLSSAMAAMGTLASSYTENAQQGHGRLESLGVAAVDAGMEYLSELINLDNLFKIARGDALSAGQIVGNLFKQAGIESSTEVIGMVASTLGEITILGKDSELLEAVEAYKEAGEEHPWRKALRDYGIDVARTAGSAYVSGLLGGGGATTAQLANRGQNNQQTQQAQEAPAQGESTQPPRTEQAQMPEQAQPEQAAPTVLDTALEGYRQNGKVSNNQAAAILADTEALAALQAQVPFELPGTASGNRAAVKAAVEQLAQNSAQETAQEPVQAQPKQTESAEGTEQQPVQTAREEALEPRQVAQPVQREQTAQAGNPGTDPFTAAVMDLDGGNREGEAETASPRAVDIPGQSAVSGQPGIKGTGAAETDYAGKHQFENLLGEDNVQPDRPTDARPAEMIRYDAQGRRVSDTAKNIVGAAMTTDAVADAAQEMAAQGFFSADTKTNRQALAEAQDSIRRRGWESTRMEVHESTASGKPREGDIAKGILLFNHYNKEGDVDSASEVMVDLCAMANRAGRDLQLFRLIRQMTPEGQLMTVKKTVQRGIDSINRGRRRKQEDVSIPRELEQEYLETARVAADKKLATADGTALALVEESGKLRQESAQRAVGDYLGSFQEGNPKEANITTNDLAQRVGERVANSLERTARESNKSMEDILYEQIMRFANDKVRADRGQTAKAPQSKNLEALANYHRYRAFFQSAWDIARARVEADMATMAADDPRIETLESFLATGAMGFIENTEPVSRFGEFTNPQSTLRRATGEAARAAGIRMDNSARRTAAPQARQEMVDVLTANAADKQAAARAVARVAVQSMGLTGDAADAMAQDIVTAFYADLADRSAARVVQMLRQKGAKAKSVQKTVARRLGELYNMGAFNNQDTRQAIFDTVFGENSGIDIADELMENYVNAAEGRKAEAEAAIYKAAGSQIKATFADKWNAWRYMSMLGNVKTQVRNIAGNAAFIPYKAASDTISAGIQSLIVRDKSKRTKAILNLASENDRALIAWANADSKSRDVRNALEYSAKLGDDVSRDMMQKGRRIFNNNVLETARRFIEAAPGVADMWFKSPYYSSSLAGFLKARGYTAEQVQSGQVPEAVLNEARNYAIEEAMRATFNDQNAFSDAIANLRYRGSNPVLKALNTLGEGLLPFRRTPANVLVRGFEYSPLGLVKTGYQAAKGLAQGDFSAAQLADNLAANLTGSAAVMMGWALAQGLIPGIRLRGAAEDEDEKRRGVQAYAIEVDWNGKTYSYTIDWAAPANLPLFVGANLYQAFNDSSEDTVGLSGFTKFIYATINVFEPMLEMSCLSSLQDFVNGIRYAPEGSEIYAAVAQLATGYLTQGIPALLRQGWQASQDKAKTTFANSSDPLIREVGSTLAGIPFVGNAFRTDKRDAWGNTQSTGNVWERVFNAFINPGTLKEIRNDPVEREIARLNGVQPVNVSPDTVGKTISYTTEDGITRRNHRLTEAEFQVLSRVQGQTAHELLTEIVDSDAYEGLTDAQKADVFTWVYDYAREVGREEALRGYEPQFSGWMKDLETYGADAIFAQVAKSTISDGFDTMKDGDTGKAAEYLGGAFEVYRGMNARDRERFLEDNGGRATYFIHAAEEGMSAERFLGFYREYQRIDGTNQGISEKAQDWSHYLQTAYERGDITKGQLETMKNDMVFRYSGVVDTAKYDAMVEAGIKGEPANNVVNLIAGLEPQKGYSTVREIEKAEAIVGAGLNQADTVAALHVYLNDSKDKDLDAMLSMGYGPREFWTAWDIFSGESGTGKKGRIIRAYMDEFGIDYAQAKQIYDIYG